MSQENLGSKAFTAGEDLEVYRRVKLSSGSGTQVEYADAGEDFIGITAAKVVSGDFVTVNLKTSGRTFKTEAVESFSVGAALYGADDGKVKDTAEGSVIGTALEACVGGDGEVVEVVFDNGQSAEIDGAATSIEAEGVNGSVPVVFAKTGITDATTAVEIVTAPYKFKVIDWHVISRDTTAANVKLINGANDMTGNTAKGTTDDAVVAGADIIAEYDEVVKDAVLKVEASVGAVFDIFVTVIRIS